MGVSLILFSTSDQKVAWSAGMRARNAEKLVGSRGDMAPSHSPHHRAGPTSLYLTLGCTSLFPNEIRFGEDLKQL
jgi:hypothetical protein